MTSLPRVSRVDWRNFGARIVSAAILASIALWAVWVFDLGAWWRAPFITLVSLIAGWLCVEWARMIAPARPAPIAAVSAIAVVAVVLLAFAGLWVAAWAAIGAGALAAALAAQRTTRVADAAYGVLYIAPAGLVTAWLRDSPQGRGWVLMLFAATWAADVCAYVVGSTLRGPKLWPRFSPNKTWTGFIGGLLGAMAVCVAIPAAAVMRLALAGAALIGLAGGLATMAGDLWESMLKRRYGVKDSGDLIPGHGGLLDRVDGLMFAVMVFAFARLFVKLRWAH
ncbi:MAG TPA: phosphatidate cytidylyltransferase [Caulobacteraceae bacterium]|nr:phosphatidate cytidylyltransferase [Caulobacteraceae bacterium]